MHARPPFLPRRLDDLAARADQLFAPAHHRTLARPQQHRQDHDEEPGAGEREAADERVRDAVAGHVDEDHRADHEGDHAPHAERAVRRQERLGHHQPQAHCDECQPRVVDRQQVQGVERDQQAHDAHDSRQDQSGMRQLEDDRVDAEQHEHVRDGGIGDDGKKARAPVGLPGDAGSRGGLQRALAAGDGHLAAIHFLQQLRDIGRDHVDDLLRERLLRGEAHGLPYRALRPLGVAPAQGRKAANVGGGIVHLLAGERAAQVHRFFALGCFLRVLLLRGLAFLRSRRRTSELHRCGGAEVGRRRHRRNVAGVEDVGSGARRACSAGCDKRRNGHG